MGIFHLLISPSKIENILLLPSNKLGIKFIYSFILGNTLDSAQLVAQNNSFVNSHFLFLFLSENPYIFGLDNILEY
jgi:hypothetical protein